MKKLFVIILTFSCLIITNNLLGQTTNCVIQIIPNDTTLYSSSSVQIQLNTDTTASFYHWSGNNISDTTVRNPIVTALPNTSNQYILQAMYEEDSNLVINGDFEQGNTGFTSDYTYTTQPFVNTTTGFRSDFYSIVSNANSINHFFYNCTNGGLFFIADGSPINNRVAYSTTVIVQPNTNYILSCDELNITSANNEQPQLKFFINNNQLGDAFHPNTTGCNWGRFYHIWNSGNSTTATISIIDSNTIIAGNDFALDNISFKKVCVAYDTVNIQIMPQIDTISDYICKGETYTNYGLNVDTGGYYSIHYTNRRGYDSVLVLNLIEITPFTDTINVDIYRGDTFTMYGFNAFEDGTYTNSYQDIYGCDSSYVLNLRVILLMFPTVVTANGDGVNDVFEIHDLLNETFFTENELYIYSRYGKQVYHKKNIKTKEDFWNPQSTNSATGSYFYRFTAKGRTKKIDFNGSLEVIR
jgi:gliding motility-associated-like protein